MASTLPSTHGSAKTVFWQGTAAEQSQAEKVYKKAIRKATKILAKPIDPQMHYGKAYTYSTVANAVVSPGLIEKPASSISEKEEGCCYSTPDFSSLEHKKGRTFDCIATSFTHDSSAPAPPPVSLLSTAQPSAQFSLYANPVPVDEGISVFAPWHSMSIGILTPSGFQEFPLPDFVRYGNSKFWGAALTLNNSGEKMVVFPSHGASDVSGERYDCLLFNLTNHEIKWGPKSINQDPDALLFSTACTTPSGRVVAAPYDSGNVLLYDPESNTSSYAEIENTKGAFAGTTRYGNDVVLTPWNADRFMIISLSRGLEVIGPDLTSLGQTKFIGGASTYSGYVVAAPFMQDNMTPLLAFVDVEARNVKFLDLRNIGLSEWVLRDVKGGYFSDVTQLPQQFSLTRDLILLCNYNARADVLVDIKNREILYEPNCTAVTGGAFGGSTVVPSRQRLFPRGSQKVACPPDPWLLQVTIPPGFIVATNKLVIKSESRELVMHSNSSVSITPRVAETRITKEVEGSLKPGDVCILSKTLLTSLSIDNYEGATRNIVLENLRSEESVPARVSLVTCSWQLDMTDTAGILTTSLMSVLLNGEALRTFRGSYNITGIVTDEASSMVQTLKEGSGTRLLPETDLQYITWDIGDVQYGGYLTPGTKGEFKMAASRRLSNGNDESLGTGILYTNLDLYYEFYLPSCAFQTDCVRSVVCTQLSNDQEKQISKLDVEPFRKDFGRYAIGKRTGGRSSVEVGKIGTSGPILGLQGSIYCTCQGPQLPTPEECLPPPYVSIQIVRNGQVIEEVPLDSISLFQFDSIGKSDCDVNTPEYVQSTLSKPASWSCTMYESTFTKSLPDATVRSSDQIYIYSEVPKGSILYYGGVQVELITAFLPEGWLVGNQGVKTSMGLDLPDIVEGRDMTARRFDDGETIGVQGTLFYPYKLDDFSTLSRLNSLGIENVSGETVNLEEVFESDPSLAGILTYGIEWSLFSYQPGYQPPVFLSYFLNSNTVVSPDDFASVEVQLTRRCGIEEQGAKLIGSIDEFYEDPLLHNPVLSHGLRDYLEDPEVCLPDTANISEVIAGLGHTLALARSYEYLVQIVQAPFDASSIGIITIGIDPQIVSAERHKIPDRDIGESVTYRKNKLREVKDGKWQVVPDERITFNRRPSRFDKNVFVGKVFNNWSVTRTDLQSFGTPLSNCPEAMRALPAVTRRNILPCGPSVYGVRTSLPGAQIKPYFQRDENYNKRSDLYPQVTTNAQLNYQCWQGR